ncbi:MAG: NUDIX hydrolase [Chloroflexi bacterium]|nr:NUDIX hydrolase [Chloroflexota bacterium]
MNADTDSKIVTLSRKDVFENTVFSVFADHIIDNNGHQVERYLSIVPKCLLEESVAGVAVLPIDKDKVGLIRVFRHPLGKWSWEAVKGHVEQGEDVRFSAVRELQEEAGFLVALEDLIDLGAVTPEAGVINARTRLFAVAVTGIVGGAVDGELGHGEMAFYNTEEIDKLIAQGEIEDASTLVLIYKYQFNLNGLG